MVIQVQEKDKNQLPVPSGQTERSDASNVVMQTSQLKGKSLNFVINITLIYKL